jgi:hypothetical protein
MSKRLLGAAALLVAGFVASAQAKPPDLPVNVWDIFTPPDQASQGSQGVAAQTPETYEVPPEDPVLPLPVGWPQYEDGGFYYDGTGFQYYWQPNPNQGCPCLQVFQTIWQAVSSALYGTGESQGGPNRTADEAEYESVHANAPAPAQGNAAAGRPGKPPADVRLLGDAAANTGKVLAARHVFAIGERSLRKGDLDMAYSCYQEVHLLAPTSRYGLRAIDRMGEIEARRAASGNAEQSEAPVMPPASDTPGQGETRDQGQSDSGNLAAARTMFQIGERCQRNGDLDMARNCYDETRQMAPHSRYGRLAARRITQIDALRSAEEASDETGEPTPAPGSQPGGTPPNEDQVKQQARQTLEETLAAIGLPDRAEQKAEREREQVRRQARQLIALGYQALERHELEKARRLAEQAEKLQSDLPWWEQPRNLLRAIDSADTKRAKFLTPPALRPIDDRLVEILDRVMRQSGADRPTLEIVEQRPSAGHDGSEEQENGAAGGSKDRRPLYVDPPARRLTIEEHPQPSATGRPGE